MNLWISKTNKEEVTDFDDQIIVKSRDFMSLKDCPLVRLPLQKQGSSCLYIPRKNHQNLTFLAGSMMFYL